jgi:hypothetical protein
MLAEGHGRASEGERGDEAEYEGAGPPRNAQRRNLQFVPRRINIAPPIRQQLLPNPNHGIAEEHKMINDALQYLLHQKGVSRLKILDTPIKFVTELQVHQMQTVLNRNHVFLIFGALCIVVERLHTLKYPYLVDQLGKENVKTIKGASFIEMTRVWEELGPRCINLSTPLCSLHQIMAGTANKLQDFAVKPFTDFLHRREPEALQDF